MVPGSVVSTATASSTSGTAVSTQDDMVSWHMETSLGHCCRFLFILDLKRVQNDVAWPYFILLIQQNLLIM